MAEFKDISIIAPCGINCGLCLAYLRDKNKCTGCNSECTDKPAHCSKCIIKSCEEIKESKIKLCYVCEKFPCRRIKQLDKRYTTNYSLSNIANLKYIKQNSAQEFLKTEEYKWTCPECGGTICMHRGFCLSCNEKKNNKK